MYCVPSFSSPVFLGAEVRSGDTEKITGSNQFGGQVDRPSPKAWWAPEAKWIIY